MLSSGVAVSIMVGYEVWRNGAQILKSFFLFSGSIIFLLFANFWVNPRGAKTSGLARPDERRCRSETYMKMKK